MAKIAQVSAKYIIHADIFIEGVVDRPDVIGAIFGQTEGLLGSDLELRELQKSGRIGRIEVNLTTKSGKTQGEIIVPSSLDKAETSIIGAAIEIIQRIGPCNAKITVSKIEDIRVSKRKQVIDRAKALLRDLMDKSMPDSQEMSDEVAYSVRMMGIEAYGKDKLPAGPGIAESDEIIVVEGRADVLNLLKHGFKNVISMNGTSVPDTIIQLGKEKIMTLFIDGDRGGKLILQELMGVTELDFVTRAPDGKEVEELTKKEIHKALRGKISAEQAKHEILGDATTSTGSERPRRERDSDASSPRKTSRDRDRPSDRERKPSPRISGRSPKPASDSQMKVFEKMLEDLIGTRGACILDEKMELLGKVPVSELQPTIHSLSSGVFAVVLDGSIDKDLVSVAEKSGVQYLVAMESQLKAKPSKVQVYTNEDF